MPSVSTDTRYDDYYNPPSLQISDEVKDIIVRNHVEPNYIRDIDDLFKGKRDWKKVGQIFETTSKALVAIGGIISFAAGFFDEYYLSFLAGAVSTISLATLQFSSFGYKESKKQSIELNTNLKRLKIEEIPVSDRNADDTIMARGSYVQQTVRAPPNINYQQQEVIYNLQNHIESQSNLYKQEMNALLKENEELKKTIKDVKDTKVFVLSDDVAKDIKEKDGDSKEETSTSKEEASTSKQQTLYKSGRLELARTSSGEYTFNIHPSSEEKTEEIKA